MGSRHKKELAPPSCPDDESEGHYSAVTGDDKFVADYAGVSIFQVQELDVFTYWQFLRDAIIYGCQQTDDGREYLEKCWVAQQTEPDRKMLRQYFGKH